MPSSGSVKGIRGDLQWWESVLSNGRGWQLERSMSVLTAAHTATPVVTEAPQQTALK